MDAGSVAFTADGLFFREWVESDTERMVQLFDTDEMNRWTPLPSPFTPEVAAEYVKNAHEARRRDGTLQLAICDAAGSPPLGEVILFPSDLPETVELAYAVGAEHRGRGLGARALGVALDLARLAGARRAVLMIAVGNEASQATATAAGFTTTDQRLQRRERKGFVLEMQLWVRQL